MIEPIVDISRWQDDVNVDTLLSRGVRGVYIKAGYTYWKNGLMFEDSWFQRNYEKFHGKIPLGCYYWFVPGTNGAGQGMFFSQQLIRDKVFELPPAIDVEENNTNTNKTNFQQTLKACLNVVAKQSKTPAIYTRGSFWNVHVGNPAWASAYKLWAALYNDWVKHPWNYTGGERYRPLPWNDYWLWQYSEKGDGPYYGTLPYKSNQIDLNRCNMTESEWAELVGGSVVVPEPPPEPEMPETVTVNAPWGLRVRNMPTTAGSEIMGVLLNGTRVQVLGDDGDWYKVGLDGWVHKDYVR